MSAFSRSSQFLRAVLRSTITSKASISSKPAKHNVTVAEQVIAMVTMFVTVLGPSGYILVNLDEYKKR